MFADGVRSAAAAVLYHVRIQLCALCSVYLTVYGTNGWTVENKTPNISRNKVIYALLTVADDQSCTVMVFSLLLLSSLLSLTGVPSLSFSLAPAPALGHRPLRHKAFTQLQVSNRAELQYCIRCEHWCRLVAGGRRR